MRNFNKGDHSAVMAKRKPKKGPAITHSPNEARRALQEATAGSIIGFYGDLSGGFFAGMFRAFRKSEPKQRSWTAAHIGKRERERGLARMAKKAAANGG
jgi:hypothetical protein